MITLTLAEAKRRFAYDPSTGEFIWLAHRTLANIGKRSDRLGNQGYRIVTVGKQTILAHRLAWFLVNGIWPESQLDHINLDKTDNRIDNLRAATRSENQMNIRARSALGKGVTLHAKGKFQAQIKRDGRNYHLGLFGSKEEAHAAYRGASKILFGEFRRSA